ncbi:hypothetical protein F6R98_20065 [Candidatus Methylospira mobilis]|uniref:Uncharacterized protein n=1 Tax=Candidatus Methylospira mobilis TaxID=1808979 RepID=A0A5Q0BM05_9GAMM|nr:hypothetical protein [Candidatus Methylospira mobilis]QFY44639.1 hypothetical protein F6R98_20065 [Candidatus Methylospira mobilis]
MAAYGLSDYVDNDLRSREEGAEGFSRLEGKFYSPGFWVSFAAHARDKGANYSDIQFINDDQRGYCEAIKLPSALNCVDTYPYPRRNEGVNYSPLVLLENAESTDGATQTINACIRNLCSGLSVDEFSNSLCEVVGDLHDNVWSHGKSTGFSMAQRWKKPYSEDAFLFEFALADRGIGFLRELRRVGLSIRSDAEAIDWCIKRGNSSKLVSQTSDDGWDQRLPSDMMGNPMLGIARVKESDNHHQGLGLAKLTDLVATYSGTLWLATGEAMYVIEPQQSYTKSLNFSWKGVSVACRFDSSLIVNNTGKKRIDNITSELIGLLGGGYGGNNT